MTRLPETVALLGIGGPLEVTPTCVSRQFLNHLRLLCNPLGRAVKFQKECRRDGEISLGIPVNGVDLGLVQQFDARHGNTILNRIDDRPNGAIEVWKSANCRGNRFRNAIQLQRNLGNHPQRSLGADKKPSQVITGCRLAGTP